MGAEGWLSGPAYEPGTGRSHRGDRVPLGLDESKAVEANPVAPIRVTGGSAGPFDVLAIQFRDGGHSCARVRRGHHSADCVTTGWRVSPGCVEWHTAQVSCNSGYGPDRMPGLPGTCDIVTCTVPTGRCVVRRSVRLWRGRSRAGCVPWTAGWPGPSWVLRHRPVDDARMRPCATCAPHPRTPTAAAHCPHLQTRHDGAQQHACRGQWHLAAPITLA